jgi:hypothetical protein
MIFPSEKFLRFTGVYGKELLGKKVGFEFDNIYDCDKIAFRMSANN